MQPEPVTMEDCNLLEKSPRVLSIQSHVVHGYCGNRSAVFPLQLHGFEVDAINSVQFCNHTWYKVFQGQVLNDKDLQKLYEGLKANNLHKYDYVLTGYIASESFLHTVCQIVKELKEINPDLVFICDPVMGDDGVWYVPKELLPIYQTEVIKLADIFLPNQWEAEQLTGMKIGTTQEAVNAMQLLHEIGPRTVVMTSMTSPDGKELVGLASTSKDGQNKCIQFTSMKINAMFIGTGDLFAALWLAWSHKHGSDIQTIASKVQSTMQLVLNRTYAGAKVQGGGEETTWEQRELHIIQSKKDLENPHICVQAILRDY